jgi:hypothetical protein
VPPFCQPVYFYTRWFTILINIKLNIRFSPRLPYLTRKS